MNDYLTAIATAEISRTRPRPAWSHRPYPRRRKSTIGARIAAFLRPAPARPAAAAVS